MINSPTAAESRSSYTNERRVMSNELELEKQRQDAFPWTRSEYHQTYNQYLCEYKIKDCLSHVSGESLLDLACGDGLMTAVFAQHFKRVVGVDASGAHLEKARIRCPELEFVESLIETIQFDETFDAILMLDVLEHMIDPIAALKKSASFLAPGGRLVAHVPNANAVNRKINVIMGSLTHCAELSPFDLEIAGHRRSYTLESLTKDFEDAGLKVVHQGGIFFKMLSTPQMDWLLSQSEWANGGHGWGRSDDPNRDWRSEFCRACYEYGKEHPADCNVIYAVGELA